MTPPEQDLKAALEAKELVDAAVVAAAHAMRDAGATLAEIGEVMGMGRAGVQKLLRRTGERSP